MVVTSPGGDLLISGRERHQLDDLPLAGGTLCLHTSQDPQKETPNEDVLAVLPRSDLGAVLILADGAGGQPAGQATAALAVETLIQTLSRVEAGDEGLRSAILDGIERANQLILDQARGGATTLEVVEINQGSLRSYHIGDSSSWLIGGRGSIKFQTVSHSPVGYAVESGLVDPADAPFQEDLHLVSNLLGTEDMRIEIGPVLRFSPRDTLLMASDGLTDNLIADEMVGMVRKGPLPEVRTRLATRVAERIRDPLEGIPSKPDDVSFMVFRPGR